jgi:uncharacterized protein (TIGR00369 family)
MADDPNDPNDELDPVEAGRAMAALAARIGSADPLELARASQALIPQNRALGTELLLLEPRAATVRLPWQEALLGDPETGALAGGVVTTVIDNCAGLACAVAMRGETRMATLDLRVDYLRPSRRGEPLMVRAECYRTTRHVAFVRAEAWHELGEKLIIATAAGTFATGA